MVYETFLEDIKASVQQKLGRHLTVTLEQVLKNNGLLLDGLSIVSPGSPFVPTIYLNDYYKEAEKGLSLTTIVDRILVLYKEQTFSPANLCNDLQSFESIKDNVSFKLLNAADNEILLSDVPHYIFLDLAIVFYLMVSECKKGQMTALIHHSHLEMWNVKKEVLLPLAKHNTPLLFPVQIVSIENALMDLSGGEACIVFPDPPPVSLHVLTNQNGINGAVCMLYENVLKNFAARMNDDIIIIPSSIHEVLLTPMKKALSYEDLNEMISLINQSEVPPEDRLSDHIYHYSKDLDCITIPPDFSESSERWNPQ